MDTSGSMDTMKKYLARSFFFLLYQFICTKYRNVELVFIAHHTEAHEVTEEEFFHKGESGGTFISSGYKKALEIIQERYHPSLWNVYAFHCSDGDNFDSDNAAALKAGKELCDVCNLFGYGEIKPLGSRYYESSMLNIFRRLEADNFQTVLIERKEDIWPSFKAFLARPRRRDRVTDEQRAGVGNAWRTGTSRTSSTGTSDPREGRGVRARLLSAGVRDLRSQPDARLHGLSRHAVALSALVLRQDLREAEDDVRPRGRRSAVRDGDQLEPVPRLPDARQLALPADPDHRARLRPQRLLQEQLHLHSRRAPSSRIGQFKAHADRVRDYGEDPSIGLERVETLLDAAHALSINCRRNLAIRKLKPEEQRQRRLEAAAPRPDPFPRLHRPPEYIEPDLRKVPLEPEEDILLFIRDHNPHLEEWEQDLLTIVHEEAPTSCRRSRPRS